MIGALAHVLQSLPGAVLLADGGSPETWVAVGSAAVTVIGSCVMAFFAWLGSRDRNRISALEEKTAACEKDREKCTADLNAAKLELKARDKADRDALQSQIDALKAQLNGKPT